MAVSPASEKSSFPRVDGQPPASLHSRRESEVGGGGGEGGKSSDTKQGEAVLIRTQVDLQVPCRLNTPHIKGLDIQGK